MTEYLRECESVEYVDNSVDYSPGTKSATRNPKRKGLIT